MPWALSIPCVFCGARIWPGLSLSAFYSPPIRCRSWRMCCVPGWVLLMLCAQNRFLYCSMLEKGERRGTQSYTPENLFCLIDIPESCTWPVCWKGVVLVPRGVSTAGSGKPAPSLPSRTNKQKPLAQGYNPGCHHAVGHSRVLEPWL